jgi:c-di-GMP-binding flagellar brake protein YcgR
MPNAPLPSAGNSRYLVRHTPEIERILQDIMASKTTVSIYGTNSRDFALSSIVAIDSEHDSLLLEQGSSQEFNEHLKNADHVTCVSTHEQVHIQFSGRELQAEMLDNEPVFRIAMPRELLRLQRREYYRLGTSIINPVKCMIHTPRGYLDTVVVDISIGGLGVLAYEGVGLLHPGDSYHGCRIAMPGTGEFAVSLTVRSIFDLTLKNGRLTHRAGCQFIDLPASVETEIQRYINRVERERRARYT